MAAAGLPTSEIFKSSNRSAQTTRITETINYYKLPDFPITDDMQRSLRSIFAIHMIKAKQDINELDEPEDAICYILTVTELLFPGTIDRLTMNRVAPIRATNLTIDRDAFRDYVRGLVGEKENAENEEAENNQEEERDENGESSKGKEVDRTDAGSTTTHETFELDLGFTTIAVDPDLVGIPLNIIAGRWGIELFPIGKNVSTANLIGFRQNRVRAVMQTLMLPNDFPVFRDDLLPRLDVLRGIERAFNSYSAIRLDLATKWATQVNAGADSREEENFLITFRLTDGFGLGAPTFIVDLLNAYPELENFPELTPRVRAFKEALVSFMRESPELRGFVKVRYGPRYRLFAATTRGALIALAVAYRKQSEPTAGRFVDTTPFAETISRANAFLVSQGRLPIADTGAVAAINAPAV
jgi:hypothetical protein